MQLYSRVFTQFLQKYTHKRLLVKYIASIFGVFPVSFGSNLMSDRNGNGARFYVPLNTKQVIMETFF